MLYLFDKRSVKLMKRSAKLSLFVFIDAFGWELLRKRPFLHDILEVKAPLGTILGYSCTCDPTIITGRLPREHGHFSFFYYNPAESPFKSLRYLSPLPRALTSRGRVRHHLSKLVGRRLGYTGYFQLYNMPFRYLPLFDYSEKRDIYQKGGINYGVPTIFDYLRDNDIPFSLSNWRKGEKANLALVEEEIEHGKIIFAYLYLAEMDALLHAQGTESPDVDQKINWYERKLRRIYELAGARYETVHLFLFSDHGMTVVTETCNLVPKIEALGLRFGVDYAAVYDSTMARFWFLNKGADKEIKAALAEEPKGDILSEERLRYYGCDFPDRMYGDLFFLLKPGVLLCPSYMGEKPLAGMHGYDPEHRDSLAIFASNIDPKPRPKRLDDLFALMMGEVQR